MNGDSLSSQSQAAYDHISDFRRRMFCLDGMSDLVTQRVGAFAGYARAIKTLAKDLYAKDTHFIFELIQNAADNTYRSGESPRLSFRLCKNDPTGTQKAAGALIIQNNEVGFTRQQVEALCDVGNSTKNNSDGFIGEKGIGFKSVFRITSNPYIFSNGYSFRLPQHHEPTGLGYIVPCWVEKLPTGIDQEQTTIILPLDQPDFSFNTIAEYMQDVAPETILFLSQLKELHLFVEGCYEATLTKDDSAHPLVRLEYDRLEADHMVKSMTSDYWIFSQKFAKPHDIHAENRDKVLASNVTIAFPIDPTTTPAVNVFAYLPVSTDVGLPFVVNADFLLPSSREALREDHPWNKWLQGCVTNAFLSAFSTILENETYRPHAYSFIPIQSYTSFFQAVVVDIHSSLRQRKVIWCEAENGDTFYFPEQCRRAPKSFRTLFIQDNLPSHLQSHPIVKHELQKWTKQLKVLGVDEMNNGDILDCLKDNTWMDLQDVEWFVRCFEYLMKLEIVDGLQNLPIVPVDDGCLTCVSEQPIYFLCDKETQDLLASLPPHIKMPVAFLSSDLVDRVTLVDGLTHWIQNSLHITSFNRDTYSKDIGMWMVSNTTSLSDEDVVRTTTFLASFSTTPSDIEHILIMLNDGSRGNLSKLRSEYQHVVTPLVVDVKTGWQHTFPEALDRSHLAVLSDAYFESCRNPESQQQLLTFLHQLGVTEYPRPEKRTNKCFQRNKRLEGDLTPYEKALAQEYRDFSADSWLPQMTVTNSVPPQWLSGDGENSSEPTAEEISRYHSVRKLLFNYLDGSEWSPNGEQTTSDSVDHGLVAEIRYQRNGWKSNYCLSEFVEALKCYPWVITTQGTLSPTSTFIDTPAVREMLGDTVAYAVDLFPTEIAALLGFRQQITAEEIVAVLLNHAERDSENVDLARRSFQYLNSLDEIPRQVYNDLKIKPVICVPSRGQQWHVATNTIWSDRSDLFGDGFIYLEKHYPQLREFFTATLGVKDDVDSECYARRWLELQNAPLTDTEDQEAVLAPLYRGLLPGMKAHVDGKKRLTDLETNYWWSEFVDKVKVWCQDKRFHPPQKCYVPDDGELQQLFRSSSVPFVWRPDRATFSDLEALYRTLGIPYLSESVAVDLVDEKEVAKEESPSYLTAGARMWILTCLKERHSNEYQQAINSGVHRQLWATVEYKAEHIELEYSVKGVKCREKYSAYWDRQTGRLLHLGERTRKCDVAERLAREILSDRRYKDFAEHIELGIGESEREIRGRLKRRAWRLPIEVEELLNGPSEHNKTILSTTQEPTTQEPTTQEPTTQEPTTQEPTTQEPTTQEPTTQEPTTQEPTTQEPTTQEPTTQEPTTREPTTREPTTREPTTREPTTREPTTREPTTREPTTREPTTREPTTREPTTREPTTREPTTREPTTREPTTREPTTREPTTREPVTETDDRTSRVGTPARSRDRSPTSERSSSDGRDSSRSRTSGGAKSVASGKTNHNTAKTNSERDQSKSDGDGGRQQDQHESSEWGFVECFTKAFHRPKTGDDDQTDFHSASGVSNPERRRERTRQEIREAQIEEPDEEERFSFVPVKRWQGPNELTRFKLREWYGGKCQICRTTFEKQDGSAYFEGFYIVSRKHALWIDRPGNVLCLCANCGAKFRYGTLETKHDVLDQVLSLKTAAEGGDDELSVEVVLCGELVHISFAERHLIDLQELIRMNDSWASNSGTQ